MLELWRSFEGHWLCINHHPATMKLGLQNPPWSEEVLRAAFYRGIPPAEVEEEDIDAEIRDSIVKINEAGYPTVECCAGHMDKSKHYPYLVHFCRADQLPLVLWRWKRAHCQHAPLRPRIETFNARCKELRPDYFEIAWYGLGSLVQLINGKPEITEELLTIQRAILTTFAEHIGDAPEEDLRLMNQFDNPPFNNYDLALNHWS